MEVVIKEENTNDEDMHDQDGTKFSHNLELIMSEELKFEIEVNELIIKEETEAVSSVDENEVNMSEHRVACKICGETFTNRGNLHNHVKVHSTKKLFKCTMCVYTTSRQNSLKRHRVAIHGTGTNLHQCNKCTMQFTHHTAVESHVKRSHGGENPKLCEICGSMVSGKASLMAHYQIHGEESYQCEICMKNFRHKTSMVRHMKTHRTT